MKTEHEVIKQTFSEIVDCLFRLVDISMLRSSLEAHHLYFKPNIHENEHKIAQQQSPAKKL